MSFDGFANESAEASWSDSLDNVGMKLNGVKSVLD